PGTTRVLLIRHAETDASSGWLAGRTPGVLLNARGVRQLPQLSDLAAAARVAAVYASPLERTVQTAEAIAARCGLDAVGIDPDLNEIDFGEWTGLTFAELAHRDDWRRYNARRDASTIPGGECLLRAQARAGAAVRR